MRLVGVDLLEFAVAKRHALRSGRLAEVLRRRSAHRADARVAFSGLPPQMAPVLSFGLRPEGDVLRVEHALGDERRSPHLAPAQAVGRNPSHESGLRAASESLEPLRRVDAGPRGEKRREVVGTWRRIRKDEVVVARAVDLDEAEVRPGPLESIVAEGDTRDLAIGSVPARFRKPAAVEAKAFAVVDDDRAAAEGALPGPVEHEHRSLVSRRTERDIKAFERVDHVVAFKETKTGADLDRRLGRTASTTIG